MFQAEAGRDNAASVRRTRDAITNTAASYAISDETRGKKKRSGQSPMNRCKHAGMGIKTIVVLLVGLAFASVDLAVAQQPAKMAKIAWLGARPPSASGREVLNRELRVLGYVEGKNVAFEYRYADNKFD